ncbi:MAG: hypothetical protein EOO03_09430 [Chitinophagaceae bacterium]|nr:MAG: hypothetical protein EOO03_09430 [Chitinophagaceae bacterium]
MENLLTSYLYSFKNCPLPTVGSLVLQPGAAVSLHADKIMHAPAPHIQFVSKETNADDLLQYVSQKKNISMQQASDELSNYCSRLQEMQPYEEIQLGSAGNFYATEDGELHFKYTTIPPSFLPTVLAERVVHPDASHEMLVGDTQTNTTAMAELLDTEERSGRSKWVWAAVALGIAGILAVAVYVLNQPQASSF